MPLDSECTVNAYLSKVSLRVKGIALSEELLLVSLKRSLPSARFSRRDLASLALDVHAYSRVRTRSERNVTTAARWEPEGVLDNRTVRLYRRELPVNVLLRAASLVALRKATDYATAGILLAAKDTENW